MYIGVGQQVKSQFERGETECLSNSNRASIWVPPETRECNRRNLFFGASSTYHSSQLSAMRLKLTLGIDADSPWTPRAFRR